jgi:hypothetical protein
MKEVRLLALRLLMAALVAAGITVPVVAAAQQAAATQLDYAFFKTSVQPIFTVKRPGLVRCIQCHTHNTNSRMLLQPFAAGTTSWDEEQSRKNFEMVAKLVSPGNPAASRLLRHPLAQPAGGDPFHAGGKHWDSQDAPEWRILAAWVRGQTAPGASR